MGLWEKATHNSKEMMSSIFDCYYNSRYLEYTENEGRITSALCGIPYYFGFGDKRLKGLYIISLSTEEGYRKKGLLAENLKRLNDRLKDEFDFTFLVPQSELMADYYSTQGYFNSFYVLEERFTNAHNFKNDYFISLQDSDERIRTLKMALFDDLKVVNHSKEKIFSNEQIIRFVQEMENKASNAINLCHSFKDLEYILTEGELRNVNAFVSYDSDGKITGVAFTSKEELKRIKISTIYVSDTCSHFVLLNYIKSEFSDYSISLYTNDQKLQFHSIAQLNYASANPVGGDLDNTFGQMEVAFNINKLLQPLGMVRLLRFEQLLEYLAERNTELEFKLYIRDYKTGEKDSNKGPENPIFVIKNGECRIDDRKNYKNDAGILNLSMKEVSELLLRKKDSSNLIMEAFGIPRLNLEIHLLAYR